MDATRALLDELMGKDRNLLPNEKPKKNQHFSDPEVCKWFICGFCPHELFTNTKSDLGPCNKVHDPFFKEQYLETPEKDRTRFHYEEDFLKYLERLVSELDKRIKRGHERLDSQEVVPDAPFTGQSREKFEEINEEIRKLLKQIEELGEEGKLDEAEALTKKMDELSARREEFKGEVRSIVQQEKRMRVCDICGAFLVIGDTDKRTASHMDGKQHQGFEKIREALSELRTKRQSFSSSSSSFGGGGFGGSGGNRGRDNWERDRRRSDRSRSRSRERDRHRERDRGGRDNRDRGGRGSDRERDRDRRR